MGRMTNNFDNSMKQQGTIKESLDSLRRSVKDLYELDEDNYHMIQALQNALDEANKKIQALARTEKHHHGRTVLGFIGVAGLLYIGKKAFDSFDKRVSKLEEKRDGKEPEKDEESDG